jgi:D-glycerate 3-kinase
VIQTPAQIVLLEGWCIGATPQSPSALLQPVNELEQFEDADGRWRSYSNATLESQFLPLYHRVDQWVMLRAPSFDCVFNWRQEQERKLAVAAAATPRGSSKIMNDAALLRFIQHYERITRHCLATLPERMNHLFTLNERRQITAYRYRPATSAAT